MLSKHGGNSLVSFLKLFSGLFENGGTLPVWPTGERTADTNENATRPESARKRVRAVVGRQRLRRRTPEREIISAVRRA